MLGDGSGSRSSNYYLRGGILQRRILFNVKACYFLGLIKTYTWISWTSSMCTRQPLLPQNSLPLLLVLPLAEGLIESHWSYTNGTANRSGFHGWDSLVLMEFVHGSKPQHFTCCWLLSTIYCGRALVFCNVHLWEEQFYHASVPITCIWKQSCLHDCMQKVAMWRGLLVLK